MVRRKRAVELMELRTSVATIYQIVFRLVQLAPKIVASVFVRVQHVLAYVQVDTHVSYCVVRSVNHQRRLSRHTRLMTRKIDVR